MTTATYAPPFLQGPAGQALPWQQGTYGQPGQFTPTGFEQVPQFSPGQQPFGTPSIGSQAPGVEQIVPSIQVIVQLLSNAQQGLWTAQHVLAQLPPYIAAMLQQPYHQFAQRQVARPYSMAW
ncbi:hypothetical protein GA0070624_5394 [Micromonospora rhizosphaerae]|uniref:Uncharacterized protein n=1 Tax=Micromonospora rhizosphaerae TaxID=568872 RepID=A0A1C6T236_9ACTN|nr:hypothetical protein [Micromonospora rhizosphaerae]SCL35896.1 hypothetical protein GA0070624_5394 [Micromonospora rhizosphaerae]